MWEFPDEDLESLISVFERSGWREMHLRAKGIELILGKDAAPLHRALPGDVSDPASSTLAIPAETPHPHTRSSEQPASPKSEPPGAKGWVQVRAPILGTFYRSPKPGARAFVEVGDEVTPVTEVGLVEVMKLFTAVSAGMAGIVREIYAKDGDLVEFDQPLMLVEPSA